MNKRIQELYKQAYGYFPCPAGEPETEKFAELIVKECMMVAVECDVTEYGDFRGGISEEIKRHFGVEE